MARNDKPDRPITAPPEPQVVITRHFNAPRALVFAAWSGAEQLAAWYAPLGCTVSIRALDFRPGGSFHMCIRSPQGFECWTTGTYREIVAPERLVYSLAIADEHGQPVDPAAKGMDPLWPRETVVTVTLAERDGGTELTLRQTVSEALAKRTGAHPSWLQMLDRLAETIAKVDNPSARSALVAGSQ